MRLGTIRLTSYRANNVQESRRAFVSADAAALKSVLAGDDAAMGKFTEKEWAEIPSLPSGNSGNADFTSGVRVKSPAILSDVTVVALDPDPLLFT
jgi:hypothetical protein